MKQVIMKNIGLAILFLILGFAVSKYTPNNNNNAIDVNVDIVGQTSYPIGDIAEFEAVVTNPPKNFNKIVAWKVLNNNKIIKFKSIRDDNIIFPVGITPTKITVLMHLAYIDPSTKKLSGSEFFVKEITVGTPGPDNPIPPPNPPPTPEPKDGKYKIAVMVYKNAKNLVKEGNVASAAKALSDSYLLISKQIDNNEYSTLGDVYAGLKINNNNALKNINEDKENWQLWDKEIQKQIAYLHNNKQLPKLSDHADLFREIADGLSYVK